MKYSYGVIHGVMRCADCGWETYSYKNAQAISKIHAAKYHHKVEGELGISLVYDGRNAAREGEKEEK